jgi:hypothetical protein
MSHAVIEYEITLTINLMDGHAVCTKVAYPFFALLTALFHTEGTFLMASFASRRIVPQLRVSAWFVVPSFDVLELDSMRIRERLSEVLTTVLDDAVLSVEAVCPTACAGTVDPRTPMTAREATTPARAVQPTWLLFLMVAPTRSSGRQAVPRPDARFSGLVQHIRYERTVLYPGFAMAAGSAHCVLRSGGHGRDATL